MGRWPAADPGVADGLAAGRRRPGTEGVLSCVGCCWLLWPWSVACRWHRPYRPRPRPGRARRQLSRSRRPPLPFPLRRRRRVVGPGRGRPEGGGRGAYASPERQARPRQEPRQAFSKHARHVHLRNSDLVPELGDRAGLEPERGIAGRERLEVTVSQVSADFGQAVVSGDVVVVGDVRIQRQSRCSRGELQRGWHPTCLGCRQCRLMTSPLLRVTPQ